MSDGLTVIDGHVHIYECFSASRLFNSACKNLRAAALRSGAGGSFRTVLLLTETSDCDWFRRTRDHVGSVEERSLFAPWTVRRSVDETCSMHVADPSQGSLSVIAGYQVVTAEGLEVLALATENRPPDGQALEATLASIVAAEAIPVLPWGVGKWLGRRGRLVEQLMNSEYKDCTFLGDNAGRPWFWPAPRLFALMNARDRPLLSGSDPLPLAAEAASVGRTGFAIDGALSDGAPARDLRRLLTSTSLPPIRPFGGRESFTRFCNTQLSLRFG